MNRMLRWMAMGSLALASSLLGAQTPYRIIVPSGPGTGNDVLFRAFAPILSAELGEPVVVDNKSGADGAIAIRELTRAPSDGRTLLAVTDNMLTMNFLLTPYDPKQIKPIVWLMRTTAVLLTRPDAPYRTLEDMLVAARNKPNTVPFGIGAGVYRFNLPLIEAATNSRFLEIPYSGTSATMLTDMLGGRIDATMIELGGALPLIQSGRAKALAVLGTERNPTLPDVPAIAATYPSYSMAMLFGLAVSNTTSPAIAKQMEAAVQRAARQKEMVDFFTVRGQMPYGATGDEVAPSLEKSAAAFRDLVSRTNILQRTQGN